MPGVAILSTQRSQASQPSFALKRCLLLCFLVSFTIHLAAQEPDNPPPPDQIPQPDVAQPAPTTQIPRTSVHGTVRNSASGEPLPRALVRVEGDASSAVLTDGEGRFEINGVPIGMQIMGVSRPGYRDTANTPPGSVNSSNLISLGNGTVNFSMHNVRVSPDMPDLEFAMEPTNAIRGQIDLSTGDPGQNIGVTLLRRAVQDGRAVWQSLSSVRTNSDGAFRFANLGDGDYIVYSEPTLDTEVAGLPYDKSAQQVSRPGFPSLFYPDARDLSSAGKIHLAGGETAQANLLLTEESFRLVKALVTFPGAAPVSPGGIDRPGMPVDVEVLDAQGHHLPYSAQFDWHTHTAQTFLPDGTYSLLLTAMPPMTLTANDYRIQNVPGGGEVMRIRDSAQQQLGGEAIFSVAGRSVTSLRIPLGRRQSGAIQVSLRRSDAQSGTSHVHPSPIVVMVSQAGGLISDGMVSSLGEGYDTGPIEMTSMNPGLYWVHTNIPQKEYCEGSFTAGAASLAREPLALSLSGSTAPLTLTLRDDCATLRLALPANNLDTSSSVIEPFYTVYVIPDFDSTTDITPLTLRPSSGGSVSVSGLTPGSYHIYTFAGPADLEYHNPEALAALSPSPQTVTLTPGMTSDLTVEVPAH